MGEGKNVGLGVGLGEGVAVGVGTGVAVGVGVAMATPTTATGPELSQAINIKGKKASKKTAAGRPDGLIFRTGRARDQ